MIFLYRCLYAIFFLLLFPKFLFEAFRKGAQKDFLRRCMAEPISACECNAPIIWLHAVSLGETHAAAPLIEALQQKYPDLCLITSHATRAGQEASKKLWSWGFAHILLPFEFLSLYKRLLRNIPRVDLLIYVEGDVWPLFTQVLKERGAWVALISGKMSEKAFRRYALWPSLATTVFSGVDLFCLQSDVFEKRFLALGIPQKLCAVTGNIKIDRKLSNASSDLVWQQDRPIVVFASTHDPEEKRILSCAARSGLFDIACCVVVPRHPYRAKNILDEVKGQYPHLVSVLLSECQLRPEQEVDIVIVDAMGLLMSLYARATVAVVCGSFLEKVGGHNILEPASVGCPFLVGPYMHAQSFLCESAKQHHALFQVTSYEELVDELRKTIEDPVKRAELAQRGYLWAESVSGAVEKTLQLLPDLS